MPRKPLKSSLSYWESSWSYLAFSAVGGGIAKSGPVQVSLLEVYSSKVQQLPPAEDWVSARLRGTRALTDLSLFFMGLGHLDGRTGSAILFTERHDTPRPEEQQCLYPRVYFERAGMAELVL